MTDGFSVPCGRPIPPQDVNQHTVGVLDVPRPQHGTTPRPEISVVIPLYNKELYIRRAVDSVLRQTFNAFEVIIVDSSTDRGPGIVDTYSDPRIVHIRQEKDTAAAGRNLGVRSAQSDFIAFLDADDEWQPDHLATLIRLRQKFPDAGLYSTPYVKIRAGGRPAVMLFIGIPQPPWEGYLNRYLQICSRGDEPLHSSSCAVLRSVFHESGGFPGNLKYGEDQFLWGKISLTHPVAFSWDGIAIYHTEAEGRICNESHEINEHPFAVHLRHELEAGMIPPEKIPEVNAYIRRKKYAEIFARIASGQFFSSREKSPETIRNVPDHECGENAGSSSIIGRLSSRVHESGVHDMFRRFYGWIHGYYDPGRTAIIVNQELRL